MELLEDLPDFDGYIEEALKRRKVRVRAGKRQIKWKCPPGYKIVGGAAGRCVKIVGAERMRKAKATRKRLRTVKAKGAALQNKANRKRRRSLRRRRGMGLR